MAQLQQEAFDVLDEPVLHVPLALAVRKPDEVEDVRVLGCLLRHVGVGRRQGRCEVADRPASPFVQAVVDPEGQDVARPPLLDCFRRVPKTLISTG